MKYIITNKQYQLLKEDEQEILHIPSLDYFGGWDGLQEYLKRRGNPPFIIDGDVNLWGSKNISLGNLIQVRGNLTLGKSKIKSLRNLKSVDGNLDLSFTNITSLGNLTYVGGDLDIVRSKIYEKYTTQEIYRKLFIGGRLLY